MAVSIAIIPSTIARGATPLALGFSGSGFVAGERLRVYMSGERVLECNADLSGNVLAAVPNPGTVLGSAAPTTTLTYFVQSANGPASATLTVT